MKQNGLFLLLIAGLTLAAMNPVFAGETDYANDTLRVIHQRKSVRTYTDQPVSREQLMTLVRAAMAAPTAVNKQPWAFIIITERERLLQVAEVMPYAKMAAQAQAAILVCGDLSLALPGDAQAYWIQDCSAAVENLLLAAESLGLGAVWTGAYPIEERVVTLRSVLGLPKNIVPLALIPVGYPDGKDQPKDKFKAERIHWEKW